LSYFKNFKGC